MSTVFIKTIFGFYAMRSFILADAAQMGQKGLILHSNSCIDTVSGTITKTCIVRKLESIPPQHVQVLDQPCEVIELGVGRRQHQVKVKLHNYPDLSIWKDVEHLRLIPLPARKDPPPARKGLDDAINPDRPPLAHIGSPMQRPPNRQTFVSCFPTQ